MATVVTMPMVKRMREMRAEGATYLEIATEMGCSINTVERWTNERAREKQREYERARYLRMKANPEEYQRRIEANRLRNKRSYHEGNKS